jgi:hypothetical protein
MFPDTLFQHVRSFDKHRLAAKPDFHNSCPVLQWTQSEHRFPSLGILTVSYI